MGLPHQNLKIISINVNGLNEVRKRRLVFSSLKKFKRSIFLLQETHCRRGNGRLWKSQWRSSMFLSEVSGSVGGLATLFSGDLDPIIEEVLPSRSNRFLITSFRLEEEQYRIVNLYLPTSDKEREQIEVLSELDQILDSQDGAHLFMGGDFNVAMDAKLNREGYADSDIPNRNFRSELRHLTEKLDLEDIWRSQNSSTRDFTWSRAGKLSRLDYIFTPFSFPGSISAFRPKTYGFSDHRMVSVSIRPSEKPRGKSFWKFKVSLLDRQDFCTDLVEAISEAERDSVDLPADTKWEFIKSESARSSSTKN